MKGGRVAARAEDAKDGRGKVVTLSAYGVSMRINGTHYEKAKAMHGAMGGDESEIHARLFSLLCRYDTLEGAGFQAAIGEGGGGGGGGGGPRGRVGNHFAPSLSFTQL